MQQQPIFNEEAKIIQLSRYDSNDKKDTNNEWTNILPTPLSLNPDDVLMLKQVFLDNRQITSDSIEIPRDMNVNFQFIFWLQNTGIGLYDVDYSSGDRVITNAGPLVDGMPFMLVNQELSYQELFDVRFGKPVIEQKTISLKKDIYSKSNLGSEITRQMQEVNIKTSGLLTNTLTNTSGTIVPYYLGTQPNPPFQNFSVPLSPPPSQNIVTTMMKQLYFADLNDFPPSTFPFDGSLFYLDENNQPIFCKLVPMINPTEGHYSNVYNDNINKMLVPYAFMNNLEPIPGGKLTFTGPNNLPFTITCYDCGFIGASIPSLQYNLDGNNKFSFVYHSPIINDSNISVGSYTYSETPGGDADILENKISILSAMSGVMMINIYENQTLNYLEDDILLLQLLGFEKSDLIPIQSVINVWTRNNNLIAPETTNKQYFTYDDYMSFCTRGFVPLNILSTQNQISISRLIPYGTNNEFYNMSLLSSIFITLQQNGYNLVQSTNFDSIIASNYSITSQSDGGHFLIDISSYNGGSMISASKLMDVKGICGNYLFSQNFSQTLGPDSYSYIEPIGDALTLTQFTIRILNPLTKQPADWMGPNSTVYLQIIKRQEIDQEQKNK
jgi:hypothetical protein